MKADLLKSYLKANCLGRRRTVPGSTLEHTLHLSGNELRKYVNRLRRQGVPIAWDYREMLRKTAEWTYGYLKKADLSEIMNCQIKEYFSYS